MITFPRITISAHAGENLTFQVLREDNGCLFLFLASSFIIVVRLVSHPTCNSLRVKEQFFGVGEEGQGGVGVSIERTSCTHFLSFFF